MNIINPNLGQGGKKYGGLTNSSGRFFGSQAGRGGVERLGAMLFYTLFD